MKKKEIQQKFNISEKLFSKLINENKITRSGYRDYEIDKDYFKVFSTDKYWKEYSLRKDVLERRKISNHKRSISMLAYYRRKTINEQASCSK